MSVVVKRNHPSGEVGISVAAFTDDSTVVIGIGNLRDMKYIKLSATEADEVADAIDGACFTARQL